MEIKTKLKRALLSGLLFSAAITFVWFLFKSAGVRRAAIVTLCVGAVVFVLKLVFDIVADRIKLKGMFLANILFSAATIIVFFITAVYVFAPAVIFKTSFDEKAYNSMAEHGDTIEKIEINGGEYSGWLMHNASDGAPLVLYYGGNEDNSSARMAWLMEENDRLVTFSRCNFAYVDYPGYGKSAGTPSDKSLKEFGLAVYDYFDQRSDVNDIVIMGYSLGTGVANYVASQRNPKGLVLMAPYADGYDLYNNKLNIFHGPLRLLVSYKMRAEKFAKDITVKPLILASKIDETVPYESSARLFQAYGNGCDFVTVNIGHREFWENSEVMGKVREYIAGLADRAER